MGTCDRLLAVPPMMNVQGFGSLLITSRGSLNGRLAFSIERCSSRPAGHRSARGLAKTSSELRRAPQYGARSSLDRTQQLRFSSPLMSTDRHAASNAVDTRLGGRLVSDR